MGVSVTRGLFDDLNGDQISVVSDSMIIEDSEDEEEDDEQEPDEDPNSDDVLECGDWQEDQFGEKLITGCQQFNVELPEPDPKFNPVSHSHLVTFRKFLDPQFFDEMAETTNIYFGQQLAKNLWKRNSEMSQSLSKFESRALVTGENIVTGRDIEIFFGIVLQTSIVDLPWLELCWEGHTKQENISSAMSISKFNHIRANIQLVDLQELTAHHQHCDHLQKVAPLLARFQKTCEYLPAPGILRIIETIIPRHGMARDPKRYYESPHSEEDIIRIFTLRSQSGLILGLRCYSGKGAIEATATEDSRLAVVKDLTSNLSNRKSYKLLLDEGFCTVELLKRLSEFGISATGILKEVDPDIERLMDNLNNKGVDDFAGVTAKNGTVYICQWTRDMTITVGTTEKSVVPLPHRCADYFGRIPRAPCDHNMLRPTRRYVHKKPSCASKLLYWILGAVVRNSWLLEHRWRNQIEARNSESVFQETSGRWESLIKYTIELAEELMRPPTPLESGRQCDYEMNVDGDRTPEQCGLPESAKKTERG